MTTISTVLLNELLAIPYIDNFYSEAELADIMHELKFLTKNDKLHPPAETASALDGDGKILKSNKGLFLDEVYVERNISDILRHNRKVFATEIPSAFPCMKAIKLSNRDTTLVSYYENSDYYEPHVDRATLTILSYVHETPKAFEGGDLYLPEYDVTLPCVNNRVYFMPSLIKHAVTPIQMRTEDVGKGLGRYCISQFLTFV